MEMIKWFRLPVNCELSINGETSISDSVVITGYDVLSSHHVEKVEIAINSYDANQKLIAKQAEQIKALRDALIEIASLDMNDAKTVRSVVEQICDSGKFKLVKDGEL